MSLKALHKRTEDLTGATFGFLKVIEFDGYVTDRRRARWRCECCCGKTLLVLAGNLRRSQHSKSCGCKNNPPADPSIRLRNCAKWWNTRDDDETRFWMGVKSSLSGCWEWRKASICGYGVFRSNSKTTRVHRFSWELHYGPIRDGLFVCHKCDNPRCVRPDHLFLGTTTDNMQDMLSKGRGRWQK